MSDEAKTDKVTPPVKGQVKKETSTPKTLELPHALSVRQLADQLGVSAIDIIKQLMRNDIMANINQVIDYEVATTVAQGFGYETRLQSRMSGRSASVISEIKRRQLEVEGHGLKSRPAVRFPRRLKKR